MTLPRRLLIFRHHKISWNTFSVYTGEKHDSIVQAFSLRTAHICLQEQSFYESENLETIQVHFVCAGFSFINLKVGENGYRKPVIARVSLTQSYVVSAHKEVAILSEDHSYEMAFRPTED